MKSLASHFAKESIALRQPLTEFDFSTLKSFRPSPNQSRPDFPLEALGTKQYLWKDMKMETPEPGVRNIWFFVSYYSNPRDKVPHTPEVCYRQAGAIINSSETMQLTIPDLNLDDEGIEARVLDLNQDGQRGVLAYFFCVNGKFCTDREQVRWSMSDLSSHYVYFAKIEVVVWLEDDSNAGPPTCRKLLTEALPVLVGEHFPSAADLSR